MSCSREDVMFWHLPERLAVQLVHGFLLLAQIQLMQIRYTGSTESYLEVHKRTFFQKRTFFEKRTFINVRSYGKINVLLNPVAPRGLLEPLGAHCLGAYRCALFGIVLLASTNAKLAG